MSLISTIKENVLSIISSPAALSGAYIRVVLSGGESRRATQSAIKTILATQDLYVQITAVSDGQTTFSDASFAGGDFKYINVVNSRYILPTDFSLSGNTITLINAESAGVYSGETLFFHFQK